MGVAVFKDLLLLDELIMLVSLRSMIDDEFAAAVNYLVSDRQRLTLLERDRVGIQIGKIYLPD